MAVNRISGLVSGMDTESLVKQLMNAESLKMNRLKQQRQITEWKQVAYRSVASSLQSFQNMFSGLSGSSMSSSLRLAANFNVITTSIVDKNGAASSVIKATSKSASATGSFSLDVKSIAKKDTYVSNVKDMTYSTEIDASKLLDEDGELTLKEGDNFSIRLDGAAAVTFKLTEDDITGIKAAADKQAKIAEVINKKLADRYGFDKNTNGQSVQKVSFKSNTKEVTETIDGQPVTKNITTFSFVASAGHTVQVSQGTTGTDMLNKLGYEKGGTTGIDTGVSLVSLGFEFPNNASTHSFTINGATITLNSTDTLDDVIKKINESDAEVTLSFDRLTSAFKFESNRTGTSAAIKVANANGLFAKLGFDFTPGEANKSHVSIASDAIFEYNGVRLSRENNDFELDGIAISLTDAAVDAGKLTVNLTRDTQKPFELIVKFVDEYNKMIEALSKQFNTSRPKSSSYSYYEPLTEDQRSAMSDREVELWEEKAKTGVLYRDNILSSLNSELRSMIYAPVKRDDGSSISLHQIGVTTSSADGYIGKLQINEDKLRAALENNPDAVADLFAKGSSKPGVTVKERKNRLLDEGLGDRLNDIIKNAIDREGTIYKRAGLENTSSFTDNELYKQLSDQDEKIASMVTYLTNRENYYYSMFARMESAMAKANNQANSLSSLFSS